MVFNRNLLGEALTSYSLDDQSWRHKAFASRCIVTWQSLLTSCRNIQYLARGNGDKILTRAAGYVFFLFLESIQIWLFYVVEKVTWANFV